MACAACERRRQQMKAYIAQKLASAQRWAAVRAGKAVDAKPSTNAQADAANDPKAPAEGSGQASPASPEHGKRRVARNQAAGAAAGRVSVSGVRKASSGKAGAR